MTIDVYHDTVCPWCRIGKAHLRAALAGWEGEPVEVRCRTFFLNDDIPEEGHEFAAYMHAKGGGSVPLEQWFARPREMGAQAGLEFNFERITKAPNSTRSHELIAAAPEALRERVIDALYDAYFRDGRDIGSPDELIAIAGEAGMDAAQVRRALEGRTHRDAVLAEYEEARRLGVSGVPFFVLDGRAGFSGAQPPEVMTEIFTRFLADESGADPAAAGE